MLNTSSKFSLHSVIATLIARISPDSVCVRALCVCACSVCVCMCAYTGMCIWVHVCVVKC